MAAIQRVTVFGAGLMGAGIAQVAAQSNYAVRLVDQNPALLSRGLEHIRTSLSRIAKKSGDPALVDSTLGRIETTTDPAHAVERSDLVIEAILERLAPKQELFGKLDTLAPERAMFVSNTSSLSVASIMAGLPAERRKRTGGLHFFNPVPQMKLVEIVAAKETSADTMAGLEGFVKGLGKVGVRCKDTPGFVVNRLLLPYLVEAVRMVERGEATKEDVDAAMKLGAGYPMGPFELMDYVGLDTIQSILQGWYNDSPLKGDPSVAPSSTIDALVREGRLGNKTGSGFYEHKSSKPKL